MPSFVEELLTFLSESPTPFHAVQNMSTQLEKGGFNKLDEDASWRVTKPGRYYTLRNQSSLVAFTQGNKDPLKTGLRLIGAHTDSPCLRVKPNPTIRQSSYLQVGVEVYGGVLLNPWFDRDLSLAGRVTYSAGAAVDSSLINFGTPIGVIPSLAIHLDRKANESHSINPQKHLPPVLMQADGNTSLESLLEKRLQEEHDIAGKILGHELSFYDVNSASLVGVNNEFIASARLDNLLSCFVGLKSLLLADDTNTCILVCNDHEEVGSTSNAGAHGPFLRNVIERLFPNKEELLRIMSRSVLVSTDNAHGIHPNYADKHDTNHGPLLNKGPVIKINANQRYATNSVTQAYFSHLCDRNDIPYQTFVNRSDLSCGSTIGPITATELGIKTIDIGLPTFGMHSIRELGGAQDPKYLHRALVNFLNSTDIPNAL